MEQEIYCTECDVKLTKRDFALKEVRKIAGSYYCWNCANKLLGAEPKKPTLDPAIEFPAAKAKARGLKRRFRFGRRGKLLRRGAAAAAGGGRGPVHPKAPAVPVGRVLEDPDPGPSWDRDLGKAPAPGIFGRGPRMGRKPGKLFRDDDDGDPAGGKGRFGRRLGARRFGGGGGGLAARRGLLKGKAKEPGAEGDGVEEAGVEGGEGAPEAAPKNDKTKMYIIGGGVAALLVIVVLVFALGGDDNKKGKGGRTTLSGVGGGGGRTSGGGDGLPVPRELDTSAMVSEALALSAQMEKAQAAGDSDTAQRLRTDLHRMKKNFNLQAEEEYHSKGGK